MVRSQFAAVAIVVGLAACTQGAPTEHSDYVSNHPISVNAEALSYTVTLRELGAQGSRLQQERIREFVTEYIDRGIATMVVETASPGKHSKEAKQISYVLEKLGLRAHEYNIVPGTLSGPTRDTVTLTFRGARAVVPECGDWSSEGSNSLNRGAHKNYGCAYRRNIGLMVANPLDLSASSVPAGMDSRRAVAVTSAYQSGQRTQAQTQDVSKKVGTGN